MSPMAASAGSLLLGLACLSVAGPAGAQTLESSALRLEVTAQPYAFRVIEKSSGEVLLMHTRTVLASGNAVESATSVNATGNSLTAGLRGYGGAVSAAAPPGTIPLFVREGAIVPRGDIVKSNNNWDANWSPSLRIEAFPSAASSSRFDYYDGKALAQISASPAGKGIEITVADLGAPGVIEIYWRDPARVLRDGRPLQPRRDYAYDAGAPIS